MAYSLLKQIHVMLALLTVSGFLLRGIWMMRRSPLLHHPVTRTLPHIVDTVFLISGLALAALIHQYPFVNGWLTAKIFGLLAYIILGSMALKRGSTRTTRIAAFISALAVFLWIVSVARLHSPTGLIQWLI